MRAVHRGIAARAAGVPYIALRNRRYHGERQPAVSDRSGSRGAEKWSVANVLAVRVARVLEYRFGVPLAAMSELFDTLWNSDEAELRRQFTEGRRFVLLVGKQPCGKALFTEEEISANELIDVNVAAQAGFPSRKDSTSRMNTTRSSRRCCSKTSR